MREKGSWRIKKWVVPLVILLILLISFATYQWIIPRTDLEIRSVYHESPGGGGTGGAINYNVLITNWGNRKVEDLSCSVRIVNSTGGVVASDSVQDISLSRKENVELKLHFIGDQFSRFRMYTHMIFDCGGDTYIEDFDHSTHEDQMNLVFVDNIG